MHSCPCHPRWGGRHYLPKMFKCIFQWMFLVIFYEVTYEAHSLAWIRHHTQLAFVSPCHWCSTFIEWNCPHGKFLQIIRFTCVFLFKNCLLENIVYVIRRINTHSKLTPSSSCKPCVHWYRIFPQCDPIHLIIVLNITIDTNQSNVICTLWIIIPTV